MLVPQQRCISPPSALPTPTEPLRGRQCPVPGSQACIPIICQSAPIKNMVIASYRWYLYILLASLSLPNIWGPYHAIPTPISPCIIWCISVKEWNLHIPSRQQRPLRNYHATRWNVQRTWCIYSTIQRLFPEALMVMSGELPVSDECRRLQFGLCYWTEMVEVVWSLS